MHCRRCQSLRLIVLDKKLPDDNDVMRCQDCGFLFSPPAPLSRPASPPLGLSEESGHRRANALGRY